MKPILLTVAEAMPGVLMGLFILILLAIVFLLIRNLMLWYWKVNSIEKELKDMNATNRAILSHLEETKRKES